MGKEYKIKCSPKAVAKFDDFVRLSGFFESFDKEFEIYNVGKLNEANWPIAHVKLAKEAIYFCDNLTSASEAAQLLRHIIDYALRFSDSVEIVEV